MEIEIKISNDGFEAEYQLTDILLSAPLSACDVLPCNFQNEI